MQSGLAVRLIHANFREAPTTNIRNVAFSGVGAIATTSDGKPCQAFLTQLVFLFNNKLFSIGIYFDAELINDAAVS